MSESSRRHRDDFDAYCPRLGCQIFVVGGTCFSPTSARGLCVGCVYDCSHVLVKLLRVLSSSLATTEEGKRKIEMTRLEQDLSLSNLLAWLSFEYRQIGVNHAVSVLRLDPVEFGACPLCKGQNVGLVWQIQFLGEWRVDACCSNCGTRVLELVNGSQKSGGEP